MEKTTSADGTVIAYDRTGDGPPLVYVGGAFNLRSAGEPVAALLKSRFTVLSYDRRGRGDSGDTAPYAVEREIEDLAAVLDAAGGAAAVYGMSSGAALVIRAAAAGLPITGLALYEPPYSLGEDGPARAHEYVERLTAALSAGRRDQAVEMFLRNVGTPAAMVAQMRHAPIWPAFEAIAPTLAYDAALLGDGTPPADLLGAVAAPTLVIDGGASPDWMHRTALRVAELVPGASHETLDGQTHDVSPDVLVPVLAEFFG